MRQIRFMLLLSFALLALFFTGCGGSGGSSTTLSPEELEIATVVEAFSAAINQENRDDALINVFASVQYYGGTAGALSFNDLSARLQNLFDNAGSINFRISNLGVTVNSETLASARGQLELEYTPTGGIPQFLTESVELKFEKDGRWGIVEFAQYGSSGTTNTAFPPQL